MSCPVCRRPVEPGLKGMRLDCRHWVHTACLDQKNPDFAQCAACKGIPITGPIHDPNEPDSLDGHDYIMNPIEDSIWSKIKRSIQKEPYIWFAGPKKPLEWIVREQGYNLQRMLCAGVSFQNLMDAGYSWETDIRPIFKDFAVPERAERGREALAALRMTADHLRDYPHLVGSLQKDMGITGRHLVVLYGLYFPDKNSNLRTVRKPWVAKELVGLGFTMRDLQGAGLETIEQYASLAPTDEDEERMGVTDADVDRLVAAAPAKPVQLPPSAAVAPPPPPVATAAPPVVAAPIEAATTGRRVYFELPEVVVTDRPRMTKIHGLRKKN